MPRKNQQEEKMAVNKEVSIITNPHETAIMVMTPEEYAEWSASQGRIMGRLPNQKTYCSEEELRVLINSGYTRAKVMEKHGMSDQELNQLLVQMSNKERRDRVVVLH